VGCRGVGVSIHNRFTLKSRGDFHAYSRPLRTGFIQRAAVSNHGLHRFRLCIDHDTGFASRLSDRVAFQLRQNMAGC